MAELDGTAFSLLPSIPDDSGYVYLAMYLLSYGCSFTELNVHQMQFVLACAQMLKKNDGLAEFPES